VVVAAEGAVAVLGLGFFAWCFLWLFLGGLEVVPISSAKAKLETETVNNIAKAINKAFFILASLKW